MQIECTHCGVRGTLDDAHAGKTIRCPKCRGLFVAGSPAPASQESVEPPIIQVAGTDVGADQPSAKMVTSRAADEAGAINTERKEQAPAGPPPALPEDAAPMDSMSSSAEVRDDAESAPPFSEKDPQIYGDFNVGRMLRRAWELTAGVKGPIWCGLLVVYGVTLGLTGIAIGLVALLGVESQGLIGTLFDLVSSAISSIFTAGLLLMGIHRASGEPVVWSTVFAGFPRAVELIVASLLQMILIGIGFLLLILPGVYLMVGYMMTFPLMLRRDMGPWQAMEASRKAIHKVWWKMFGLSLLMMLICAISAIPLGIGMIWTMPMAVVLGGVVYRSLFTTPK